VRFIPSLPVIPFQDDLHFDGVFILNKPASFNLLKFKTWLTLPDAAKHLSDFCEGEFTEADILQLALDGYIKLSVRFINPVKAMRGKIVGCEDAEWREIPAEDVDMFEEGEVDNYRVDDNGKVFLLMSEDLGGGRFLNLTPGVVTIPNGIFDLPMIGYSKIAVECKRQESRGEPAIDLSRHLPRADIDGVFVEDLDGGMLRLQASFEDVEELSGSRAQKNKLIEFITYRGISDEEAEELLIEYSENRKKLLMGHASLPNSQTHFLADSLPEDSAFVIRADALTAFEMQHIADDESKTNAGLSETERNTMLKLNAVPEFGGHNGSSVKPSCGGKSIHKMIDRAFYSLNKPFEYINPIDVMGVIKQERSNPDDLPTIDTENIIQKIEGNDIYWITAHKRTQKPLRYRSFSEAVNRLKVASIANQSNNNKK
jgi:hypothetical protein